MGRTGTAGMQHSPTRRALAGSVLVLGSVGTVSAVHLEAAPVPAAPDGRSSATTAPPTLPDPWAMSPAPGAPSGWRLAWGLPPGGRGLGPRRRQLLTFPLRAAPGLAHRCHIRPGLSRSTSDGSAASR